MYATAPPHDHGEHRQYLFHHHTFYSSMTIDISSIVPVLVLTLSNAASVPLTYLLNLCHLGRLLSYHKRVCTQTHLR